ncbi:site-specific integrase [Methylotuvimicrobium sp. KM2]|uniref:site-specific integrase n=1 Tax=Methylotuvimicrobium sp. KM2 TaxID=3133976 RepID=UPI00310183A9
MDTEIAIWNGWKFTQVGEKPEGLQAYRYYLHRRKRNLLQWGVINILKNKAPALVNGTPDNSIDDACIQEILQEIEANRPGYELKHCRNFLIQGLDRGVREGLWKIRVPAPVFTVRRAKALFQPESFIQLPEIRRIQTLLMQSCSDPEFFQQSDVYINRLKAIKGFKPGDEHKQLRGGQLLLSALLNGGLLEFRWLMALPDATHQLQVNADCCWIDFFEDVKLVWESDESREAADKGKQLREESVLHRRWFPDSVTELLLLRWRRDKLGDFPVIQNSNLNKPESYCQYLINVFLKAFGFERTLPIRDLLKGATTTAALELPAFLLNFAAGNASSTSLPVQAWQRLYSDQRGQRASPELNLEENEIAIPLQAPLRCDDSVITRYDQYRLYQTLSQQLALKSGEKRRSHAQSIQIIEAFLQSHQEHVAPPLLRLCQWAIEMYRNGSYTKARLAVSTVPKYLGQIKDLVNVMGSEDPLALEAEELLEIYQELVESSKTVKAKAYKAGRIKEFHYFLLKFGYTGSINFSEISGVKNGGSSVDANYINETAYQATLTELNRVDASLPRYVSVRRLIMILGYRCGLRRTEAHKIRLCDIQLGAYPVLLVRANAYKTVKSPKSTRQIPLKPLLSGEEFDELMKWIEYRRLEQALHDFATDKSFLFSHEHNGQHLIDEPVIFPVIQMVLRTVTGDQSTRYHHLRHSFGNNLLFRLMNIAWPELAFSRPTFVNEQPAEDKAGKQLFGLNGRSPSRKHLYQVSLLLGHANPEITMKNYIHLCDYALRHYLNQALDTQLPVATVTVITGIGREALYKTKQRKYPALSVLDIAKKRLRDSVFPKPKKNMAHAAIKQNEPIDWPPELLHISYPPYRQEPSIAILHQIIEHLNADDRNSRYWADKIGYPEYRIQAWLDAAAFLANMRTGKGASRHIRPQWYGLKDAEKKRQLQEGEIDRPPRCMYLPHKQQDVKDAQQVFKGLQKLRTNDTKLAQWGVRYFLENNIAHRSHLRMRTQADAEKFKDFIQGLGRPKKRLNCQLKAQTKEGSVPAEEQIRYWAKVLSIKENQISLVGHIRKRGDDNGSLRMTIVDDKGVGSFGFRYAIYMTGVLMLGADEILMGDYHTK